jgi:hypothetical protein
VVGELDRTSGETNDIVLDGEKLWNVSVDGADYYVDGWFATQDGITKPTLNFYDADWNITTVYDFPNNRSITLNGKTFDITVGTDRNLILTEVVATPPAVTAYVSELKAQFTNMNVTLTLQSDKTYLIQIAHMPCPESMNCSSPAPGSFGSLSLKLDASGKRIANSMTVSYNGVIASGKDADLLFDSMTACPQGEICAVNVMAGSDAVILKEMASINVAKVDNGSIYFTKDGNKFKTYRDEQGNVQLKRLATPFDISISANTSNNGTNLRVRVLDENGNAEVTRNGETRKGVYDPATK